MVKANHTPPNFYLNYYIKTITLSPQLSPKAIVEDKCKRPRKELKKFRLESLVDHTEESRDSLRSEDSGKADLCFRSKFITDELVHIFMDTESDEEFEGFPSTESTPQRGRKRAKSVDSEEEDSEEDTGFYSDGECAGSVPPRRQSSGLCVAFRFPIKKSLAMKTQTSAAEPKNNKCAPEKRSKDVGEQRRKRAHSPSRPQGRVVTVARHGRGEQNEEKEEEEEGEDEEEDELTAQALSKRARNIEENKAMLAKLFADLEAMEQISPLTTPKKKKAYKKRATMAESERRNPSRKARPRDHFGVEEKIPPLAKEFSLKKVDLRRLVQVGAKSHGRTSPKKRRSRKNTSFLPVEDITQEDLDNVADRACDKIHDKDNGSTCHQCRQKTLDTKTVCRSDHCVGVKGQFCGPCLRNRYGEDVREALLDPAWECPICRGMCNCSICRKRDGRCATGALTWLAKHYGHSNVKEYLERYVPLFHIQHLL
ncbi:hypothetical protein ACEWY4_024434 [Coilia grayii]|uniref:Zinc-finger domain-containing protein n=1 Tax=Coilia grayii TaxID=363190 RepID=A0ABD1J203_9TELE